MQGADFFALIGEGVGLLKGLEEDSPGFFDSLNRAREILALLGDDDQELNFSLADKEASAKAITEYLESGMNDVAEPLRKLEAFTVSDLAVSIKSNDLVEAAGKVFSVSSIEEREKVQLGAFHEIVSRGVVHGIDQKELVDNFDKAKESLAESVEENPEYKSARAAYGVVVEKWNGVLAEIDSRFREARTLAEKSDIGSERIEAYEKRSAEIEAAWEPAKEAHRKFNEDRNKRYLEFFESNGKKIIDTVAAASPVSEQESTDWAKEQIIDDNAKAKLKKLGYSIDDVHRDMAEFYRLSGGKSSAIRISINGKRRASASGISTRLDEKILNLGSYFNKTVLFHELAHHLEGDPIAKAASNGFLLKRRESAKVYTLKSLTGSGYHSSEVAYKDSFMDAYVGKVYSDGITEVFSMGVQYLSNPKDAAIFAAKDPEMFALVTGYLSSKLTPAMKAKLNMHKGAIDDLQTKRAALSDIRTDAISSLSSQVSLYKDDWFESLNRDSNDFWYLNAFAIRNVEKSGAKYVGSSGIYRVFSGKFVMKETKRVANGYMVFRTGYYRADYMAVRDIESAKALISVAQKHDADLSNIWSDYFWEYDWSVNKLAAEAGMSGVEK